jgi:DNA-binding response OmpR family regulator
MEHQRVLLIEDNATTAGTASLLLRQAGFVIHHAFDGATGLGQLESGHFDLVLLDLMLPDLDGLQVCRRIRAKHSVPVIMLTARSTEDDIVAGLESGASDYLCKPYGTKELLARVRRVLRDERESRTTPTRLRCGEIELDPECRQVHVAGLPVRLTRSEFQILKIMMSRPGRVFTRNQLIELALGPDFDGLDRTIDTHIWSLRRKLGDRPGAPRYIHSEPGVGYRMENRNAV